MTSRILEWGLATGLLLVTACAVTSPSIRMVGPPRYVSALEGSWTGEYQSGTSGRYGNITFHLAAGSDTAFGSVLMLPGTRRRVMPSADRVTPPVEGPIEIPVAFVFAGADSVFGALEPYEDPISGGTLRTSFFGRRTGDRIEGTFQTLDIGTGRSIQGDWSVARRRSAPVAP